MKRIRYFIFIIGIISLFDIACTGDNKGEYVYEN